MQAWLDGKSCFSHTNTPNFRRPLQSLLLRYTAENLVRLPNFNVLFQLVLTNFFQKWTVFVFTESWLRDQVIPRAYFTTNQNCPAKSVYLMVYALVMDFSKLSSKSPFHFQRDWWGQSVLSLRQRLQHSLYVPCMNRAALNTHCEEDYIVVI